MTLENPLIINQPLSEISKAPPGNDNINPKAYPKNSKTVPAMNIAYPPKPQKAKYLGTSFDSILIQFQIFFITV